MPDRSLAAVLRAGADALSTPELRRLAGDLDAPLRVAVTGHPGAGCDTVRRALRCAGVPEAGPGPGREIEVRVLTGTPTDADRAAVAAAGPAVVVLGRADLAGVDSGDPLAAAAERCRRIERSLGVPTRPLAALLAVAGSEPDALDEEVLDGLRALAAGSARPTERVRGRLRAELGVFGAAVAVRAIQRGADRAAIRAEFLQLSGIGEVAAEIERAGAAVRYRRAAAAVTAATRLATGWRGDPVAKFLAGDDVVLGLLTHALDAAAAAGMDPGPDDSRAALLRRAVLWQRVAREGAASDRDLARDLGRDIVRGSLRLWVRAGGRPEPLPAAPAAVSGLRRARIELAAEIRSQCAALRTELQTRAAELPAGRGEAFAAHARGRAAEVGADLDRAADRWLGGPADAAWAVPAERYPPLPRRPDLENRLAALLGTGFGLGVALTAGRLVADLGPPWAPAGVLCCSAAGLALACWVVRTRRLLAERAALDRWVGELTAALSIAVQERVAARLVAVSAADAAGFRGGGRPR